MLPNIRPADLDVQNVCGKSARVLANFQTKRQDKNVGDATNDYIQSLQPDGIRLSVKQF